MQFRLFPAAKDLSVYYFISIFIFLISTSYIAGALSFFYGSITSLILFYLPHTGFGIFYYDTTRFGGGYSDNLNILAFIVLLLSCFAFWSAIEIRKRKYRGLLVYTAVNMILIFGMVLDLLFSRESNMLSGINYPITFGLFCLYLLTLIILWSRRKKFD